MAQQAHHSFARHARHTPEHARVEQDRVAAHASPRTTTIYVRSKGLRSSAQVATLRVALRNKPETPGK
jgi:hypothetical protein